MRRGPYQVLNTAPPPLRKRQQRRGKQPATNIFIYLRSSRQRQGVIGYSVCNPKNKRTNKTEKDGNSETQTPRTNHRRVAPTRKRQRKGQTTTAEKNKENNETPKHPGQITDGSLTHSGANTGTGYSRFELTQT